MISITLASDGRERYLTNCVLFLVKSVVKDGNNYLPNNLPISLIDRFYFIISVMLRNKQENNLVVNVKNTRTSILRIENVERMNSRRPYFRCFTLEL